MNASPAASLGAVEFHTGLDDPLAFACRLLRKACRTGARVLVSAPAERLATLDRLLWTFDERDFVPHLRLPCSNEALRRRTPLWLTDGVVPDDAPEVLVNLGADAPAELARFRRLIEIVGTADEEVAAGRLRWRLYRAQGLTIRHHADPTMPNR